MYLDKYINPLNIKELSEKYINQKPFPSIMIDNFLREEFANSVLDSFPSYADSTKQGVSHKSVNEHGKFQITDSSKFKEPVALLNEVLASEEFLSMISVITGIPKLLADDKLVGGGIHQTGSRGVLDVHVDFNYLKERQIHRRLNILIYFNKSWNENWGGNIELWDKDVKVCHHSFTPIFNRCVIFTTNDISFHGVTAVNCPEGESRKSFAAYYYTNEAPPEWTGEAHDTIFRARPNERAKKYVYMPMQQLRENAKKNIALIKKQIKTVIGINK